MTGKSYSAPPGLCTVPGCTNPRHVSKSGNTYTRCDMHCRERNKQVARKRHLAAAPVDMPNRHEVAPEPETVHVMVLDWTSQRLFHVTGRVDCTEEFPPTDGDMKKIIALASQQGIYVAYIRAWKPEDLYENN
jgi:hypothetical protein